MFKALTEGYLLEAYQAQQAAPKPKAPRASPALARQRNKLQTELADTRNSLHFFQTSPLYTAETRQPLVREVTARIAELERHLAELGA